MEIVLIYIIFSCCIFILLGMVIINDIRTIKNMKNGIYKMNKDSKKTIKKLIQKVIDKNLN